MNSKINRMLFRAAPLSGVSASIRYSTGNHHVKKCRTGPVHV
ncbi:hypothetical protein D3OALGA1CA_1016 [Olavius algarvensis associated proteobacterium Delta 3]|nr:hypothetical protein D3OALGA1CA_1016 [Olavius algarvensis associated proteobacterium Delta 3]CAB5130614.1 hypothetical protein D3OALGB2SA_3605 [Olavius algarvensis associated proteobacterium Delta 3]